MQIQIFKKENILAMKSIKSRCKLPLNKAKIPYFTIFSNNKQFWNWVKSFLTNKSPFSRESITIKEKNKSINDEKELVEIFNNQYTNTVEKMSVKPVESSFENCDDNSEIVLKIIKKQEKYQNILEIRKSLRLTEKFEIPKAEVSDINKLLKA